MGGGGGGGGGRRFHIWIAYALKEIKKKKKPYSLFLFFFSNSLQLKKIFGCDNPLGIKKKKKRKTQQTETAANDC